MPERHPVDEVDQRVGGEAVTDPEDVAEVELVFAETRLPFLHDQQWLEQVEMHERGQVGEPQPVRRQQLVVDHSRQVGTDLAARVHRGGVLRGRAAEHLVAVVVTRVRGDEAARRAVAEQREL